MAAAEPVEAATTPQVTAIVEHPAAEEASAPRASSNPILDAMNAAAAPEQHAEQFSALGEQPEPPPKPTTPNVGSDEATYLAKLKDPGRRAFHDLVRDLIEERHQKVLPVLEDVRARLGGEFRGEENYRKLAESLDRKLQAVKGLTFDEFTDPAVGKDVAGAKLNELALKINDPLRYTLLFPEGDYARGAAEILQGLHERGFRLLEPIKHGETKIPGSRPLLENGKLPADAEFAKNSWREGNRYLGINLTLVDEHGGPFELQFHTPMSFEVKEHMSHLQYEVFRRPEAPMERRVNAMLELVSLSDKYLWGRIPEGLDEFAPRAKDSGMDELFKKIAEDYGSGAETPEALYQADQKLFPLEVRQEEIRKANQDLAEHLNRLTGGGLSDAEIQQAFLDTVDLLRAREQLTTDPAEWHRLQYETPAYEPPQHGTAPAHPTEEPASHAHQPQSEQPGQHGQHNDPTALGPSATDHAHPHAHPTLHLEHPIALSPDHLVFPFRDETGNQQFAHLQHVGERWVLHAGGPEGEALTALGDHLRTTPPGLDLIGHATPDGFLLGGKTIPFEDVLAHIPAATTGEGPIRLIACDAGGAAGEAARRLADMSGRTVVAADTPVWVTKDGHVVAANPVDRATNWYPKRPPDGVWSSYEPGGGAKAIHPGGPDDQLLPKAPEGWDSAHGGSHVEFTDLAGDRSRIDRSARRLLDTLLPKSKDAGFDLDQPLHGESAFWNMIDADHVVTQIGGVLPRAFRGTVDRLVEHAMWLQEADRVDTQRGGGLGTSPDERRPIGSPLSEIGGYLNAELREHPVARNDYASMAGIPIDNKWFGPTSSQAFTMFRESIPEGGVRGGNYQALRENLGVYVHQLPEGRSGQDVAIAMRNLLATGSDEARRANLVELAKELDPGFAGLDQQDWQATAGGKFVSFVTTLSHLVGHIEVGRNPEAITNLMALDLAGRGVISLDDAVGYFNIMHPVGAAGMTRIAHAGDPQQASPAFEAYVPDADRRRFAGNTNHLTVGVSAVEMYERQSRVVAMYAADFARQDPAEWARFQRDPGAYLLDNQWLLIDVLLKKYTNPT
ncbi:MAG: hypothetical protein HOW97_34505 [Catenulispora sp.]|nr:hypothetical protein [Catenulispora sp.]